MPGTGTGCTYSRHGVHFDEKKVKNRIADICSLSNKLITPDDFKAKTGRHPYQLKPEWHGLLFALMDTDYFDNRKNKRLLNTRDSLHRDLIVNIENYLNLNPADKKIIENYPGYLIAKVESLSSEAIAFQMQTIVRDIMTSDDTIRFKLLRRTYDTLNQLILDNQRDISKHWAHKTINSINLEQAEHNVLLGTGTGYGYTFLPGTGTGCPKKAVCKLSLSGAGKCIFLQNFPLHSTILPS